MVRTTGFAALTGLLIASGCGREGPLGSLFNSEAPPYEQYLAGLKSAGLDSTALARDWISAGETALARPVAARLPFRETGYFPPHAAGAVAYRLELRRGRKLAIEVKFETAQPARLFVDLFRVVGAESPDLVASLPADTTAMVYDVRRDGTYVLRLQPELLRGGRWTVEERTQASLGFPIPGFSIPAIRSRFGVDRDAGRRRHHGVDIFAPRGTPVIAVVEGYAQSGTNELGGNVVWLRDGYRGRNLYYAHLDRWAIDGGAPVRPGDTLGFVGTTGNARTTPPHLHFGIYDGGPVDPEPFLLPDDPAPARIAAPLARLDEWVRVTGSRHGTLLRTGPHRGADSLFRLQPGSLARVSAASLGSFRVRLPDRTEGYLDAADVTSVERPVRRAQLEAGIVLEEGPDSTGPAIEVLGTATDVDVLGRFGEFELVRLPDARLGWVAVAIRR
jgi:murein DD-endopeptidase MepM/ murein hydrolase activator NlpD